MPITTVERHFKNPPVRELILGIQFNPLPERIAATFIPTWWDQHLRDEYPVRAIQDRLIPQFVMPDELPPPPMAQFLGQPARLPRYWFSDAQDERLIQVQQDMLIFNWRKMSPDTAYPSFGTHYEQFRSIVKTFEEAWTAQGDQMPQIQVNQCEVTYIDQIFFPMVEEGVARMSSVLKDFGIGPSVGWNQAQIRLQKVIELDSAKIAALALKVELTTLEIDEKVVPALQMVTTVKGEPSSADCQTVLEFHRQAKEEIADIFFTVTTEEVQKTWQ